MHAAFNLQQVLCAGIPERLPLDLGWEIPFPFPIIFPVFCSTSLQLFALLYVCERQYCVSGCSPGKSWICHAPAATSSVLGL